MEPQKISLSCTDGFVLAADYFPAPQNQGAVLIAPALGVPRRIYSAFARYLAERGLSVLTLDYRGTGDSVQGPVRGKDMRMADWGQLDIEAALGWLQREQAARKLFLIGHSAGGQLPGLAAASEQLAAMIFVGASRPRLDYYPLRDRIGPGLLWKILIPLFSGRRDMYPSKRLGFSSVDVATGVMREWAAWAGGPAYLFSPEFKLDTARYRQLALPILSYCFLDDAYAPPAAVNALLEEYSAAQITRREIPRPARGQIGHFGYFRDTHRDTLWKESADWLLTR